MSYSNKRNEETTIKNKVVLGSQLLFSTTSFSGVVLKVRLTFSSRSATRSAADMC